MQTSLQVQHLKKYFDTHKAVDDISFELKPGSVFGLLGPNGAGKTTLIRMITGIFYPDEGNIILNGKAFKAENDIIHIGYMPEERGLYKKMKVGEHAIYLAQLKGLSKKDAFEKVKYWFEKFEMQSWWHKKIEDLSKGMSQKLQFVTTVLHEPSLIILDEPFSGLDPVNANLIKDEIKALSQKGASIIFSTHRMEQVEEICDHIILVNQGKKILDGTVSGVKQDFKKHLFAIQVNEIKEFPTPESFEILEMRNNQINIKIKEGYTNNQILQYFINSGMEVTGFQEILPSLNEIFIQLVGEVPAARPFSA
jgi:ABC-2 type transport system ATP-binding protein